MEGPSLCLAAQQLESLKGKRVERVFGNSKAGIERLDGKTMLDIFSWGKHLVFQFDTFAMRIHFMLFGTFEAQVGETWVTGDYRKAREPRVAIECDGGRIYMYNCSVKFFDDANLKRSYDYSIDIMSRRWDEAQALNTLKAHAKEEIADALLDQTIFAGVGNIIKNEVLSIVRIAPTHLIADIPPKKRKELVEETRAFSKQFLAWRKKFVLRKHLKVHGRGTCPHCGGKLIRQKTGKRQRWSYWCPICQV